MAAASQAPESSGAEWRPDMPAVLVSRVFMFAVLYWAAGAFPQGSAPRGAVLAYGLSTILFLATWTYAARRSGRASLRFLLFFQFLVELSAETVVFIDSGGYESYHGFLFILTIVSGGVFFGYTGSLGLATFASLIFGAVGGMHLGVPPLAQLADLTPVSLDAVQMRFFLTTSLFFLVALLSSDGSRRLVLARRELAGAKEALHLARFSAESMMQDLPTGILFFDPQHRLRYRNQPAEHILGKPLIEGSDLQTAWDPVLGGEVLEAWVRDRAASAYDEIEATAGERPLRVLYKPLVVNGEFQGSIFTLFDLSEEKRMERRLLRQERMAALGQMSARIAHEIRNPLASISGAAQMLRDSQAGAPEDQKLLRLIVGESNRLNRFLSDLLDYVRERPPSFRKVSLRALLRRVVPLLEKAPAFRAGLASIDEIIAGGDVEIVTDQDILLQILLNVGLNALEAMDSKGGKLTFSVNRTAQGVRIDVADTGPGMDSTVMARALDPFFTTKPQGTGLGLSVCALGIQALQGNITLTSTSGQGTIVSLSLPVEPQRGGIQNDGHQG